MAQKYRKVDPRIWDDEKFVTLDEQDKLVTLHCLTSIQVNRIGIFRFSIAMAAEQLGTLPPTFHKRFGNVCRTFNWPFHEATKTLYFPTWWKYNRPDNPNMLESFLCDLHDVPTSPLVAMFCENKTYLSDTFAERLRLAYKYVAPNVTPNHQLQEQEQEQEQEQKKKGPQAANGFVIPTLEEIASYCNDRNNNVDPEAFIDFYSAKGWMIGKNKMKDWQASVRTWEKRGSENSHPSLLDGIDPEDVDREKRYAN
jgi:hypothetical protein